jgi:hypothetical protein
MDRIEDRDDEVVELGIASNETKGPPVGVGEIHGLTLQMGISDDD